MRLKTCLMILSVMATNVLLHVDMTYFSHKITTRGVDKCDPNQNLEIHVGASIFIPSEFVMVRASVCGRICDCSNI